jgi:hypothetical protein
MALGIAWVEGFLAGEFELSLVNLLCTFARERRKKFSFCLGF